MIDYTQHSKKHEDNSITSNDSSTIKSVWNRLSHLFHTPDDSNRRLSTSSNESDSSSTKSSIQRKRYYGRRENQQRKKRIIAEEYGQIVSELSASSLSSSSESHPTTVTALPAQQFVIPPYSPTYLKANEFPYSNFYVKLPNGKWMVRYRSGNRDILGTDEFEGYMI